MSQQKVYRKKGETQDTEEVKGEQPKHEKIEEGTRGGRGGRGRGGRGSDRPHTSYQDRGKQYQKRGEGNQEGDQKRERRERDKDLDENTYVFKYFYGPRPKYERVEVKADTEVPAITPKDQRKRLPDKADYDKKVKVLDTQIEDLRQKIRNIAQKKREFIEGGTIGNSKVTFKDYIQEKIAEVKPLKDQKRKINDEMQDITNKLAILEDEKNVIKKSLNRDIQKPEEIKNEIQRLQKRYETTTLSTQEEKKVINEIQFLKKSIPLAEKVLSLKPQVDKLFDRKKELREELSKIKEQIALKEGDLEGVRKQQDEAKVHRADMNEKFDKFESDIAKVKEQLNELYTKKNEMKEEFFKGKLEFELERDEIYHAEWIQREKAKLVDREEGRKKRIEERKQQLIDRPNPYQKEVDTCDHLIAFCNKLKIQHGLMEAPVEQDIKDSQKQVQRQMNAEDLGKKVNEGKLERAMTKQEKEQLSMVQIGGKKKGKSRKVKKDTQVEEPFNIDVSVINKFAFLKANVPIGPDDLDQKIKEIQEKRDKYYTEGEQRLKEEEEKLADIEGGHLDDYEEHHHHEEEYDRPRGERGGRFRGGRGGHRGDRGERGSYRGGRGRGGYRQDREGEGEERREKRQFREKQEFEGDEEEDEYPEYKKASPRKVAKKEDLKMDDSNYPTL